MEAYVDNVKNEPLIASLPKAGTILAESKNDKLGYDDLILSNGVKVILKKTGESFRLISKHPGHFFYGGNIP